MLYGAEASNLLKHQMYFTKLYVSNITISKLFFFSFYLRCKLLFPVVLQINKKPGFYSNQISFRSAKRQNSPYICIFFLTMNFFRALTKFYNNGLPKIANAVFQLRNDAVIQEYARFLMYIKHQTVWTAALEAKLRCPLNRFYLVNYLNKTVSFRSIPNVRELSARSYATKKGAGDGCKKLGVTKQKKRRQSSGEAGQCGKDTPKYACKSMKSACGQKDKSKKKCEKSSAKCKNEDSCEPKMTIVVPPTPGSSCEKPKSPSCGKKKKDPCKKKKDDPCKKKKDPCKKKKDPCKKEDPCKKKKEDPCKKKKGSSNDPCKKKSKSSCGSACDKLPCSPANKKPCQATCQKDEDDNCGKKCKFTPSTPFILSAQ